MTVTIDGIPHVLNVEAALENECLKPLKVRSFVVGDVFTTDGWGPQIVSRPIYGLGDDARYAFLGCAGALSAWSDGSQILLTSEQVLEFINLNELRLIGNVTDVISKAINTLKKEAGY